jgi:hypothetical protein
MHIIFFEGLGPLNCIRRLLIEPIGLKYPNFSYQGFSYKDNGPKYAPKQKIIVIGHSFGGDAAIKWANKYDGEIHVLMTLDPRPITLIPELEMIRNPFKVPKNALNSINFYQTFPLWGSKVQGTKNVKVGWGHTKVPGRTEVHKYLSWWLR